MILPVLLMGAAASAGASCDNAMTQADINVCMAQDYRTADGELNRQWGLNVAAAKAQDKTGVAQTDKRPGYYATLLESQRAWLKFRDAQCRIEGYAMRGGSAEPMVVSGCLAGLTRERSKQLKDMLSPYGQ